VQTYPHVVGLRCRLARFSLARVKVRSEAKDWASVTAVLASEDLEAARLAEAPDPAGLVEDRRVGKEHQESERTRTSSWFGSAFGSGCTDLVRRKEANKSQQSKPTEKTKRRFALW
jgi:hypothetical protein